ncbi:MAG: hypothetical protein OEV59_07530 [Deltaproteobacteria bacterium]|nr:hypothetical protein [Deltaproteobacteria bacterium]
MGSFFNAVKIFANSAWKDTGKITAVINKASAAASKGRNMGRSRPILKPQQKTAHSGGFLSKQTKIIYYEQP